MSETNVDTSSRARLHTAILVILFLGLAVALVGNVYQFIRADKLARDLAAAQRNLQAQITRLSDATSGAFDVTQERFLETKKLQDSTAEAIKNARVELMRTNAGMVDQLDERNSQLAKGNRDLTAQLAALKQDTGARFQKASSALETTSAKVDATNTRLDRVAGEIEIHRADLKRISNDLAALRAPVAAAPKRRPILRESDEPSRIPFDLLTTRVPTKIGDIQIAIVNADPKKNDYTIQILADDKIVHDGSHAVNEAVQCYTGAHAQPVEIVVTEIRKDEVLGYVTEPKAGTRVQTSAATGGSGTGRP
jgi:hypothetical protein